jgi:hypothetical protein
MTIPASGPISMTVIAAEADLPITSPVSINHRSIRNIARVFDMNTEISYGDLQGKVRFSFENGNFTSPLVDAGATYTTPGWTVYRQQVRLQGIDSIGGFPTPTDSTKPGDSPGDNTNAIGFSYTATLDSSLPSGLLAPTTSIRLISNGVSAGYGIIHGPYLISNNPVQLEAGDTATFYWKAEGGSDAYDIYSYLLNVSTGATIELINQTGDSPGATTPWAQVSKTISAAEAGNYKFVFVSGSFDFTGGTVLGASLYVTNIIITKWFTLLT